MIYTTINSQEVKFTPAVIAIVLAIVFALTFSLSPAVARADENVLSLSFKEGKYVLDWSRYTPSDDLDGYVIEINGSKTYLDDNLLTYFDVTSLLGTPNNYKISLYANSKGVLTLIGTVVEKVVATLDKVKNLRIAGFSLTWDAVKNAKGYFVFANGVFVGFTKDTSFDVLTYMQTKGQYQLAVVPISNSAYYLMPSPTFVTHTVKATMTRDLEVYISKFMGELIASWQHLDGVEFFISIDDGDVVAVSSNNFVLNLEDGKHTIDLFGEDDFYYFYFGNTTFTLNDGEVEYV